MKSRTSENRLRVTTWPIGCGKLFKGVYHLYKDETYLYQTGKGHHPGSAYREGSTTRISTRRWVGKTAPRDELELVCRGRRMSSTKISFPPGKSPRSLR